MSHAIKNGNVTQKCGQIGDYNSNVSYQDISKLIPLIQWNDRGSLSLKCFSEKHSTEEGNAGIVHFKFRYLEKSLYGFGCLYDSLWRSRMRVTSLGTIKRTILWERRDQYLGVWQIESASSRVLHCYLTVNKTIWDSGENTVGPLSTPCVKEIWCWVCFSWELATFKVQQQGFPYNTPLLGMKGCIGIGP